MLVSGLVREVLPTRIGEVRVRVPGSKSITQRALITASLADGDSLLHGPLASEDTRYTMAALRAMGVSVDDRDPACWKVRGCGGRVQTPSAAIYLGNNGTATRFLTSVAALGHGTFRIEGDERMATRPIGPLMRALAGWGVDIESERGNDCPPLVIRARGLRGGRTVLPEGRSSQYLSSLLLVAPYADSPAELEVEGPLFSRPYVEMTLAVMADFGVTVSLRSTFDYFQVPRQHYQGREYRIEGDASAASYFWAAAAVTGGRVTVANVPVPSLQGDAELVGLLARMGCRVEMDGHGVRVCGPERLEPIEADMTDMPDVAPTLAVVAAFAEGRSVLRGVAHLRIKECDRLAATVRELGKLGVAAEEGEDYMVVHGRGGEGMRGALVETYHDHRMAMCFAVAGLRVPGVRILDPGCVAKSFPDFWERFDGLSGSGPVSREVAAA